MPYKKRNYVARRRRPARRGLATVPRMMTKSLAFKRLNQISTKVFYFKSNSQINLSATGDFFTPFDRTLLYTIPRFNTMLQLYDQYKVLGFTVKFFPSNVGIEAHDTILGAQDYTLNRGNHVVYSDQRVEAGQQVPTAINQIINNASCKMINPRRPYSRSIWRPRGKPRWGSTTDIATSPDDWRSAIYHFYQDATIPPVGTTVPLYFWTIQFKVVFRGVKQD